MRKANHKAFISLLQSLDRKINFDLAINSMVSSRKT